VIEVRALTEADEPAYAALVSERPDGLLYHSPAYRDLLVDELGCRAEYLGAFEGGELRGALPVMWSGAVANSLPFYGSHGSVLAADARVRGALVRAWDERATDRATAAATLVANPFSAEPPPAPAHDFSDERISQVTPLAAPPALEASARRNVRKADRLGVVVTREPDALGELHALHRQNIEAIGGRAKPASFFAAVPRHFTAGEEFDVYVARLDGETAALLLVFWLGAAAEYYTPAIAPRHRPAQPLAAILHVALADAAARGLRAFNWGGTWHAQGTLRRFKRKWGARESTYRYFTKLNDRALLDATPDELHARHPHFYIVPFAVLRAAA
jgi:hypothetical protein